MRGMYVKGAEILTILEFCLPYNVYNASLNMMLTLRFVVLCNIRVASVCLLRGLFLQISIMLSCINRHSNILSRYPQNDLTWCY